MVEFAAKLLRRVALQTGEYFRGGTEHDGITGMDGSMSDIFSDHGFTQPVGSHENEIPRIGNEVERQGALDRGAVDLGGPMPIEVRHRPETTGSAASKTLLERAVGTVADFGARQFFQKELWRPAGFGGAGDQVVQTGSGGFHAELDELSAEISFCFVLRVHRKSPSDEVERASRPDRAGGPE